MLRPSDRLKSQNVPLFAIVHHKFPVELTMPRLIAMIMWVRVGRWENVEKCCWSIQCWDFMKVRIHFVELWRGWVLIENKRILYLNQHASTRWRLLEEFRVALNLHLTCENFQDAQHLWMVVQWHCVMGIDDENWYGEFFILTNVHKGKRCFTLKWKQKWDWCNRYRNAGSNVQQITYSLAESFLRNAFGA